MALLFHSISHRMVPEAGIEIIGDSFTCAGFVRHSANKHDNRCRSLERYNAISAALEAGSAVAHRLFFHANLFPHDLEHVLSLGRFILKSFPQFRHFFIISRPAHRFNAASCPVFRRHSGLPHSFDRADRSGLNIVPQQMQDFIWIFFGDVSPCSTA